MRCGATATPLPVSTPASASNFFRRATSASDESASFAARRASFASSTAAWRFCRLASKRDFHEPASLRAATSAQRSSSQRASAASARARSRSARTRSRSYSDWKSRGGRAVPAEGKDQSPLALSVDLRSVEKSSSRMTMHTTIAHGETCYQPPCGRLFHAGSGCSTVGVSTARRNLYGGIEDTAVAERHCGAGWARKANARIRVNGAGSTGCVDGSGVTRVRVDRFSVSIRRGPRGISG